MYGPLARYLKSRVAHAPGMPGTFSPQLRVSDPDMHHGTRATHVPWCMPGSLTGGFLWNMWWGKRSRHPRRMRNPQFYVSGKRPMTRVFTALTIALIQTKPVEQNKGKWTLFYGSFGDCGSSLWNPVQIAERTAGRTPMYNATFKSPDNTLEPKHHGEITCYQRISKRNT